jgi:acyl-CoA hydrolase
MSLGVSVDIVKAAVETASVVIAQVNSHMPRVHGDGFIHISDVDFIIPRDEPLLEYENDIPGEVAQRIGKYVSRIVQDGDTIQVGYGSLPNAVLANLRGKHDLGVHSEFFSDGIMDLMKKGVITNRRKNINKGKTVASFCMGKKETYEYIHDNPSVEFKTIEYTNNPFIISQIKNMTAINSALEIDLTGQATAESLGKTFYSGLGGQADFMRGAVVAYTPLHSQGWKGVEDNSLSQGRLRGHTHTRGYPLCGDRIRHCLSPRQKFEREGNGPYRHSPPGFSTLASGRGKEGAPYL